MSATLLAEWKGT